jgi:hypothetical protein
MESVTVWAGFTILRVVIRIALVNTVMKHELEKLQKKNIYSLRDYQLLRDECTHKQNMQMEG